MTQIFQIFSNKKLILTLQILAFLVGFILLSGLVLYWASAALENVTAKQLEFIKNKDFANAYSLTAQDFQKATSLDQFKAFIEQYPVLANYNHYAVTKRKITKDTGLLVVNLNSNNGLSKTVEFSFIREGKEWKISAINMEPAQEKQGFSFPQIESLLNADILQLNPELSGKETKIMEVKVGDKVDQRGVVSQSKDVFAPETEKILVSAYITKTTPGLLIEAVMTYLPTGDQVGPVTDEVKQGGDIISNFSFSKPVTSWPVGKYSIVIILSDGQQSKVEYTIQ
ncbi:MAG: DUF4864 domain-containing protein [Candidatus Parcubacteria bacterium]|nr:DUF4864 domain-containing protein [Candidatus Parcubacteria bacterium]